MPTRQRSRVNLFVAMESFVATVDGTPVAVKEGDLVREGHDLLRGREEMFAPADDHVRFDVEQATAAPGETR